MYARQVYQEGRQRDKAESRRAQPGLIGRRQRFPIPRRTQRRLKIIPNSRQKNRDETLRNRLKALWHTCSVTREPPNQDLLSGVVGQNEFACSGRFTGPARTCKAEPLFDLMFLQDGADPGNKFRMHASAGSASIKELVKHLGEGNCFLLRIKIMLEVRIILIGI